MLDSMLHSMLCVARARVWLPPLILLVFVSSGAPLLAQKPRLIAALDNATKQALVLRGAFETTIEITDEEGEKTREADSAAWKGGVEVLRATNGQILLTSVRSAGTGTKASGSFALLIAGEQRVAEARLTAARVPLDELARWLPRCMDLGNLRKWIQRAAARRRLRVRPSKLVRDGRIYRVRLPARAIDPLPEESDNDEEAEDAPLPQRALAHVDLEIVIDGKNHLRALRIEFFEAAPLLALQRAWQRALKSVKGEQIPRVRLREESIEELEVAVRRVRILDLKPAAEEGEASRGALERLVKRLR